ncbi:MAG: hypothetical protein HPY57_15960 [Ignavibacteria bacterium]|nr:hypothetical protein [Ignavibacteria bacterium]
MKYKQYKRIIIDEYDIYGNKVYHPKWRGCINSGEFVAIIISDYDILEQKYKKSLRKFKL